jgi:NAD(P)-dependent dehydrogenase (short-subunit alcohol dehydrogenase family)
MTGPFHGRRVLVTGAAKGIGLATLVRLAAEGARVAALDRDAPALAALPARLGQALGHAAAVDVADSAAVADAVKASAAALGGLDGVVNAAGVDLYADIEAIAPADWERVLAVNLTGPFLVIQAAYPYLRAAGGGTIVNVSSAAGLSPLKNRTAYCASKAGLQMASKALAIEAAEFSIRVNTVCPGAVETNLFRSSFALAFPSAPDDTAIRDAVRARYALNRIAEPEEIAAAIVWLSGPESSYVTGVALAVDGGRSFH